MLEVKLSVDSLKISRAKHNFGKNFSWSMMGRFNSALPAAVDFTHVLVSRQSDQDAAAFYSFDRRKRIRSIYYAMISEFDAMVSVFVESVCTQLCLSVQRSFSNCAISFLCRVANPIFSHRKCGPIWVTDSPKNGVLIVNPLINSMKSIVKW